MTVAEKRILFTSLICRLVEKAATLGVMAALDQVKRMQAEADANAAAGTGIRNSLHLWGLAGDLLLYRPEDLDKDGVVEPGELDYLEADQTYTTLGIFWESLHPLTRWGGRFGDPGHFSITHGGVR